MAAEEGGGQGIGENPAVQGGQSHGSRAQLFMILDPELKRWGALEQGLSLMIFILEAGEVIPMDRDE